MTNFQLTDNQRAVLNAAARSANLVAWPLPKRLKLSAGSAAIVVRGLLQKGMIERRPAMGADPVWKEEGGKRLTLVISKIGLSACGIVSADGSPKEGPIAAKQGVMAAVSPDGPRRPRPGSKLAALVELLERDGGATIAELSEAVGWQPHSVRGVLSGMLTKRFGLAITSAKAVGSDRVYRLRS